MQFRNAQKKADAASLNDAKRAAFEAFEAAAGVYAAALARGDERENARVFTVWFGAALGTPQLNFVNAEELPTEGSIGEDQIERIRKTIAGMAPDVAFRHLSEFASDVSEAVMRSDPEVKPPDAAVEGVKRGHARSVEGHDGDLVATPSQLPGKGAEHPLGTAGSRQCLDCKQ